jgi:hypothetical protein
LYPGLLFCWCGLYMCGLRANWVVEVRPTAWASKFGRFSICWQFALIHTQQLVQGTTLVRHRCAEVPCADLAPVCPTQKHTCYCATATTEHEGLWGQERRASTPPAWTPARTARSASAAAGSSRLVTTAPNLRLTASPTRWEVSHVIVCARTRAPAVYARATASMYARAHALLHN